MSNNQEGRQSGDGTGDDYDDFHRIVLQGLMASGILDRKGVTALFKSACNYLKITGRDEGERMSMENIERVVRKINMKILPFDLNIRSGSCEMSCIKYYILRPTVENPIFQFQMYFSKAELSHFKLCLEAIMRSHNNFAMPVAEAINLIHKVDSRASLTVSESFVQKLLNMLYFTKYSISEAEFDITLGIRAMKEFETLLWELYPDVLRACSLCKGTLFQGLRCPNCKILIHSPCFKRYMPKWKPGESLDPSIEHRTCVNPTCGNLWPTKTGYEHMLRRTRDSDALYEIVEQGSDVERSHDGSGESCSMDSTSSEDENRDAPVVEAIRKLKL